MPARPPRPRQRKPLPALTHHDIMGLVAPFAAAGYKVDLAGSDRSARVLKFVPLEHAAGEVAEFAVRETLILDVSLAGLSQLTRQLLALPEGDAVVPLATCETFGGVPAQLLDRLTIVPLARHFTAVGNIVVSRDYEVTMTVNDEGQEANEPVALLVGAHIECHGVQVKFTCEFDDPLKVELSPALPGKLRVPQDILAVLGKSWRAAYDYGDHWRSTIRINRHEPTRSQEAEQRINEAVRHLDQTLTESPAAFHRQHRPGRWRAMFRRAIPLGGCAALIGGAMLVGKLPIGDGSIAQMLLFHAPPLLLIGLFLFRELPRFEIPPIPRKLRYSQWLEPIAVNRDSRPA
ncbi:MAG: hypothetical protein AB8C46_25005 [Burkholderiaceae bacterium]